MMHALVGDLRLYSEGVLSGPDLQRIDRHIEFCAACREQALAMSSPVATTPSAGPDDLDSIRRLINAVAIHLMPLDEIFPALQRAKDAMRMVHRVDPTEQTSRLLGQILVAESWALHAAGRFTAADGAAVEAGEMFRGIEDEVELARSLVSRSEALQAMNELPEATAVIQEARRLFRKHHEPRRELIARDQEAALLYTAGRYEDSIALLESLIAESGSDDPHRPYWLHQIASNLVRSNRDLDRADALLTEALNIKDYADNRGTRIRALWSRAKIAVLRGQYESALQQLISVYEQAEASAFTSVAMCIRCDMADLLALLGRVDESVRHARAVIDFFAREKLTRRANHALAILREAAQRKQSVTWQDLRRLRAEFPEDFVQPPILGELAPS